MKKNKGFTLVELVAVLVLIAVLGIIIYPRVSNIVEENKKKAFMESVKSTIRSYDTYLASENYPDLGEIDITSGIIPTVEASNWKSGVIEKIGNDIYVENFYDGNFCAFGYEDSLVLTRGECKKTPNSCFAFDETTKTITGYKLGGSCTRTVIIPDVIKGVNVEAIGSNAFYNKGLDYVIMPATIVTIGEFAFASNKLTSITIPNNVVSIGRGAFNDNNLPDQQAFIYKKNADKTYDTTHLVGYGGKKRSNIVVPENVEIIGDYAFRYNDITSITLPEGLKEIRSHAFWYNYLTEIELPSTLKVIESHGFASNEISNLILPDSLTTLGNYAFERNGLDNVTIPNTITSLGTHTFFCNNLTEISIPSNWTSIPIATFQDNDIESLTIPSNIKIIGNYAFYNNPINTINLGSVEEIGYYAFRYNHIEELIIPSSVEVIYDYAFADNWLYEVTFNEGLYAIWDGAFYNNGLQSIVCPSTLRYIGVQAFTYNYIETVSLNDGLLAIYWGAFCDNELTSVTIPSTVVELESYVFNANKISGDAAFIYARNNDGSIDNTHLISYGGNASTITVPSNVQDIGVEAFAYNENIRNIILPDSLDWISEYAFADSSLTSINFPTPLLYIGEYAFANCNLSSVSFSSALEEIGKHAFQNNNISSVTFSEGLLAIKEDAFKYNQITSLVLPSSIELIENDAFLGNEISSLSLPEGTYIDLTEGSMFNDNDLSDEDAFIYARNADGTVDYTTLVSYGGSKKENIIVPSTVKILEDRCFRETGITSIVLPEGLREIHYDALTRTEITEIELPSTLLVLDDDVFYETNITSLSIPASINYINPGAFDAMSKLTTIYIDKEYNSIEGAPWGAANASVEWAE